MNKTEKRWADQLEMLKWAKIILNWEFEPKIFDLGGFTYKPDFVVCWFDFIKGIDEVKGTKYRRGKNSSPYIREDDSIKLRAFKHQHPDWRVRLVWWGGKKEGWRIKKIK